MIRLRQGFGRLIRSATDRGAVLILDSRILTRPYGRVFLESLPQTEVVAADGAAILERLERFYYP